MLIQIVGSCSILIC